MEKVWETKFNETYNSSGWSNIYSKIVKSVPCEKLSEFKYKLLHNLIYPRYILNKWKPSVSNDSSFVMRQKLWNTYFSSVKESMMYGIKWVRLLELT